MTLLELGAIASKYDTALAHAMLHAIAIAMSEGGSSDTREKK